MFSFPLFFPFPFYLSIFFPLPPPVLFLLARTVFLFLVRRRQSPHGRATSAGGVKLGARLIPLVPIATRSKQQPLLRPLLLSPPPTQLNRRVSPPPRTPRSPRPYLTRPSLWHPWRLRFRATGPRATGPSPLFARTHRPPHSVPRSSATDGVSLK
jgi:hypothetical protein